MLTAAPALSAMRGADGKLIIMTGSVTLGLAALGQALGEGHADEGATNQECNWTPALRAAMATCSHEHVAEVFSLVVWQDGARISIWA